MFQVGGIPLEHITANLTRQRRKRKRQLALGALVAIALVAAAVLIGGR